MKFGKHLESNLNQKWASDYLDYKGLKDLIKESAREAENVGQQAYSPRTTSLSVIRQKGPDIAEDRFFGKLEDEVKKINKFTQQLVEELRASLRKLNAKAQSASTEEEKESLLAETKRVGDEYLALEKYVNLNYMGFHKILKKHDKCLPHAPCRQFFVSHLHQQPWVQGNYSDLLVSLSNIYSMLRGDSSGQKNEDAAQGFVRSTTKYWVRTEDVTLVKHHILQHLPVFQFDKDQFAGDAQLINSVYFDNESLELYHGRLDKRPNAIALRIRWYGNGEPKTVFVERKTHRESWKGEESVKERFTLHDIDVVPFLEGQYSVERAEQQLRAKGKKEEEIQAFKRLFLEVQKQLDSKQLRPFIRTQYMRTAFQIPFDATVRISLDTNLVMIKENPSDGPSCTLAGRWYRDPSLPPHRTEITRFPHAVLEVKLSLPEGEQAPSWVQELLDSGYVTEVHKFSKFIHGTCTLFPDLVQAVPYWVDDESVRASMVESAPYPNQEDRGHVALTIDSGNGILEAAQAKPRKRVPFRNEELQHPLLGDEATLKLLPNKDAIAGFRQVPSITGAAAPGGVKSWLEKLLGPSEAMKEHRRPTTMKIEPKTFFANERTFLSWLHMSVTIGGIAAALLGFAGTTDSTHQLSRHLVEIISLILLPLAVLMCGYAVFVFVWRAQMIAKKRSGHFDDRIGPLGLCSAVVIALSAIMIISIIDFVELLEDAKTTQP